MRTLVDDRQDEQAQQDDAYNPAQQYYDREFNDIVQNSNLGDIENDAATGGDDTNQDIPSQQLNDTSNSSSSIKKEGLASKDNQIRHKEENPISSNLKGMNATGIGKGGLAKFMKKKGAMMAISVTLTLGMGILGLLFGSPAMIFGAIKANMTNARDTGAAMRSARSTAIISRALDASNGAARVACKASASSKLCQTLTLPKTMVEKLNKVAGVKVELDDHKDAPSGDRVSPKSVTVQDDQPGKPPETARTGKQFKGVMRTKSFFAAKINRGFNGVKGMFLSSRFSSVLSKHFGFSKGPGIDGKDKKSLRESFRQSIQDDSPVREDPDKPKTDDDKKKEEDHAKNKAGKFKSIAEKVNNRVKKAGGTVANIVCGAYDGFRTLRAATQAYQITKMVSYTLTFLREFDRILANEGDTDATSYIMDTLYYSERDQTVGGKPNRFYGTDFTSAPGMRSLLHGDVTNVIDEYQKFIVGGGKLGELNKRIASFESKIGTVVNFAGLNTLLGLGDGTPQKQGVRSIKYACKKIRDYQGAVAGVQLLVSGGGVCEALMSAFAITGPFAFGIEAVCKVGVFVAENEVMKWVTEKAVLAFSEEVIQWLIDTNFNEDTVKGIDAGELMAAGAGLMLARSNIVNGMIIADKASLKNYLAATAKEHTSYIAAMREDAKATPFDITNQYSFLGSMMSSLYQNNVIVPTANVSKVAFQTLATLPAAFSMFGNSATTHALEGNFNEMIPISDQQLDKCPYPHLSEGFSVDQFCAPIASAKPEAVTVDPEAVIKYLSDDTDQEKGAFIDEAGKPTDTPHGKLLKRFNKFCVTRTMPPGEEDEGGSEDGEVTEAKEVDDTGGGILDDLGQLVPGDKIDDTELSWKDATNCANPTDEALKIIDDGPNKGKVYGTDEKMLSMFSAYTTDESIRGFMSGNTEEKNESGSIGSDDAKANAKALLDSPNINFQLPIQRGYMEQTAKDGTQNLDCGGTVPMSGKMLGMLVEASKKYKITIGAQASGHQCDNGHHPKGKAVDINGVAPASATNFQRMVGSGGGEPYSAIHTEFYQFLDDIAGKSGMKLELGQASCFPMPSGLKHSKIVGDTCNHLHVGVESGG